MNALYAVLPVILAVLIASFGAGWVDGRYFLGVIVPYGAIAIFFIGFVYRILRWARVPVPFHIPAVAGQQKSLPWIKNNPVESPSSTGGVLARMALEILLFRSLFRNDRAELKPEKKKLIFGGRKWLWLAALAFHWSLLIILLRHFRLLSEPVPSFILFVENVDGAFQLRLPTIFISDFIVLLALTFIVLRRFVSPQVRYISLMSDYFAVFLIAGVVISGVLMRAFFRVDLIAVKELARGVLALQPSVPAGVSMPFFIHLTLVCTLLAYFPFSKLVHSAGVFFSPTRNLQNDSRMVRHVNPWDYPVKVHTYEEWEDEYRAQMKKVGLPVEKE